MKTSSEEPILIIKTNHNTQKSATENEGPFMGGGDVAMGGYGVSQRLLTIDPAFCLCAAASAKPPAALAAA
jgi:hypothetical protein